MGPVIEFGKFSRTMPGYSRSRLTGLGSDTASAQPRKFCGYAEILSGGTKMTAS
jgi:hypothetical protein